MSGPAHFELSSAHFNVSSIYWTKEEKTKQKDVDSLIHCYAICGNSTHESAYI